MLLPPVAVSGFSIGCDTMAPIRTFIARMIYVRAALYSYGLYGLSLFTADDARAPDDTSSL